MIHILLETNQELLRHAYMLQSCMQSLHRDISSRKAGYYLCQMYLTNALFVCNPALWTINKSLIIPQPPPPQ